MSATNHLAQYGVTFDQGREFIYANLSNPGHIFDVALEFRVTPAMLAELYGGITSETVYDFFDSIGFDCAQLEQAVAGDKDGNGATFDGGDEKISISATNYQSFSNSNAAILTDLDDFRSDSRFQDIDGSGQTVVIIDTAFDLDNPFFGNDANNDGTSDRILFSADFTNEGNGADSQDPSVLHGTHVASIIGSSDQQYPGVAPGANLIVLQALSSEGGTAFWLEKALQWVISNASAYNIAAVNMSLGDSSNHNTPTTGWASDELSILADMGIVTVSASGNDYGLLKTTGVSYPSSDPNSLSVGAVTDSQSTDQLTYFSQRSELTDVLAPGENITAAMTGGGVVSMSGTSMAAPFIAGVAALAQQIAQENLGRRLTVDEFSSVLEQSSDTVVDQEVPFDNVPNSGLSFPRVNVLSLAEAVLQFDGSTTAPPEETADDIASDTSTTAQLGISNPETGELERIGDSDWFALQLFSGTSYRFNQDGLTLSDSYLQLLDSGGNTLAYNDDANGTLNSEIDFVAPYTGTYYLSASSYQGQSTGSYRVSMAVTQLPDQELTQISTGQYAGTIDQVGDTDSLSLTLNAGVEYQLDMLGSHNGDGTLIDPYLTLVDANDQIVAVDDDNGEGLNASIQFTPSSTATYELQASAFGAETGSYTVVITESQQVDTVPDNPSTNQSLQPNSHQAGTIDFSGDTDWYRTTLQAGTTYIISQTGSESGTGNLLDPLVTVYGATGNYISSDDDDGRGRESMLTLTPETSGTYYISAGAYGSHTGTYRLSLETSNDIADNSSTNRTAVVGESYSSTIDDQSDADWFRIDLTAGSTYEFSLTGATSGTGTLTDPYLYLYDNDGRLIDSNDDGGQGFESLLTFTAINSGTYYISAESYGSATGSYSLSVAQTQVDQPGDGSTNTELLAGQSVNGIIDYAQDEDWYQVWLTEGTAYEIALSGSSSGSGTLVDPVLELYDIQGNWIATSDDEGTGWDSLLEFNAEETGYYLVSARAFDSGTGTYSLSLEEQFSNLPQLAAGDSQSSSLSGYGDYEHYSVQLAAGQSYVFNVYGSESTNGQYSMYDPTISIYSEDFQQAFYDDDSGLGYESRLEVTPSVSSEFIVTIGTYDSGSFLLTMDLA